MDRGKFWALEERAHGSVGETVTAEGAEAVERPLVSDLTALGPSAAGEFQQVYDRIEV